MSNDSLLQVEADALLRLEKVKISDDEWSFPDLGGRIEVPLASRDRREVFRWISVENELP